MSFALLIYLIDVLANARVVAVGLLIASGIITGALTIAYSLDGIKGCLPWIKRGVGVLVFSLVVITFAPSKSTLYMMAAAHLGHQVVESPDAQEIYGKLKIVLNSKLDDLMKDSKK